ncbi:DNA repair protein RadA [Methyloceanibacter sp.]|uniref:DNA repair protein RadA n=1 Tax=Methyloceanibacter sp. TaxID=1965321 RepID=UPI002D53A7EB|nr:DNA repair protein RadA [Methyloceanibacter sp.]HZP10321.1 DNA repair protein RadA [Methyloceanibacter sp.]
MAKTSRAFVCQACGAVTARWSGKCASCGEWNSIIEEAPSSSPALVAIKGGKGRNAARVASFETLSEATLDAPRLPTGIAELDRVLGGGLVPGSAVLVGGDPGIGKSTLLLEASAKLAGTGAPVVYLSGEEATAQVRMRAKRLGLEQAPVALGTETNLANIIATLASAAPPALVVIDSVQTLWSEAIEAAPGTISQLRGCASALISHAKTTGSTLVLVGHVTKDGQIAGPKVIEHMVDTVLYFEGLSGHQFRVLRAVKNRFGPTDEIGVFEMRQEGLKEVENPSALFLNDRDRGAPGTAVFAGMEGTRPILVEIQALVAPTALGTPRRAVVGWDPNRLAMLLAVLEARCGVRLAAHDVYLNVAGGLRLTEPAADLAAAAALLSSFTGRAAPEDTVYFGEVSLTGSVRTVGHTDQRLKEAKKLGFTRAAVPAAVGDGNGSADGPRLWPMSELDTLVTWFGAPSGEPL